MVLGAAVGLIAGAHFPGGCDTEVHGSGSADGRADGHFVAQRSADGRVSRRAQEGPAGTGGADAAGQAFDPEIGIESREDLITIKIETDRPRAAVALSTMVNTYLKTAGNQPAAVA